MSEHLEIERKFRVLSWSNEALNILKSNRYKLIKQGYLDASPTTRIRLMYSTTGKEASFEQKVKKDPDVKSFGQQPRVNQEYEVLLDFNTGEKIFELTKWKLSKIRFSWDEGNLHYDLDIFLGNLRGLEILEIELPSPDAEFKIPDGLSVLEVTNDSRYSNKSLSKLSGAHELGEFHDPISAPVEFTNTEEGFRDCVNKIDDLLFNRKNTPLVVGIAGPSASGKTTLAEKLKNNFGEKAAVISADDYFLGIKYMRENNIKAEDGSLDFDNPHCIDLALLGEHVQQIKLGEKIIRKPTYSFETGERGEFEDFTAPTKLLIVEGIYSLYPPLLHFLDFTVFVEEDCCGVLWRRTLQKDFADIVIVNSTKSSKED